jgi:hypothetical protein
MLAVWLRRAADRACTRNMLNMALQMPYAISTPNAKDANTAPTSNIDELM